MALTTTKRNKRTCLGRFQRRNIIVVKVNGLGSSHSGCAGGRKGWPLARFPVRRRLGRKWGRNLFRKPCRCSGASQPIGDKCLPKNVRTCLEGPFGEVIRATGPMARGNPFRFSTKYQDDETDLVYYGYRYYSASTGRWLSRDPLNTLCEIEDRYELLHDNGLDEASAWSFAEKAEGQLDYGVARNNLVGFFDLWGLLLCQPLPNSGQGHLVTTSIYHHHIRQDRDNKLVFTVSCPFSARFLHWYGVTSDGSPPDDIGVGSNRERLFPRDWHTLNISDFNPTYIIEIQVPTRTTYFDQEGAARVRIIGECCCYNAPPIERDDPPLNPRRPTYPPIITYPPGIQP